MTANDVAVPAAVTVAMAEIAEDMREGLLALAVGAGLQVMQTLMSENVAALCCPRDKHGSEREAVRHGTEAGSVTVGGRRVAVLRPRVRVADGSGEVSVPVYELFSATEILGRMAVERMLGGLSTRHYRVGLEPVGEQVEHATTATSKLAVSRKFVAMTETALHDMLHADLSELDLVAAMDRVNFAEQPALSPSASISTAPNTRSRSSRDPPRMPPWSAGLLVDLRDRGLDVTRPILAVLDGSKALRRAVPDVFYHPIIAGASCTRIRNVRDHLPQRLRGPVEARMRRAYHADSVLDAQAQHEALARELDKTHPGAAASLREGLAETLTVLRLGVPPTLARTLRLTDENVNGAATESGCSGPFLVPAVAA